MTVEGYNTKAIWTLCVSGVCVNVRHMLEGWKLLYIYCMINDNGYCQTHKPKWRRDEAEKHFVALYLKGLYRPCLVMYCSVPRHITYKPCTILNMYSLLSHHIISAICHTESQTTQNHKVHMFFLWHYITPEVFRGLYIYTVRAMKRQTSIQNKPNVCASRRIPHRPHSW